MNVAIWLGIGICVSPSGRPVRPQAAQPFRLLPPSHYCKKRGDKSRDTIPRFKVRPKRSDNDVVDEDIIIAVCTTAGAVVKWV